MRNGFLAALTVLLTGHGLTFAQQYLSLPAGQSGGTAVAAPTPPPAACSPPGACDPDPVSCELHGDGDAPARPFGLWGSAEYLLWWIKNGHVPPLVTAGGNGPPGSPGTQVLLDSLRFADDVRQGGRFALGYQFETLPFLGVEASSFFLSDRRSDAGFSSSVYPVLRRPFINAATGMPDSTVVASPGIAAGTVIVGARPSLWGAEANLAAGLVSSDTFHLTALCGFRFLRLEDELKIDEEFQVAPDVPGFGGSRVSVPDEFRTVNRFYGGQVGLKAEARLGLLTFDCCGKLALGQVQQVADLNGELDRLAADGSTTMIPGGLLALHSNSGRHQRDELAFVPEVDLDAGWQLTAHCKLCVGYSLLWVSTVARAGEQIDPVVNVTQFPLVSGAGPLQGPARPAFNFHGTDFWAQGLNLGLELSY
jgi:hypothetical protein